MKKLNAILYLFMGCSATVFAQNSLVGKITDATSNNALPGVSIYIPDLKTGADAGTDGMYSLTNLPKGTYAVEAHLLGYATQAKTVILNGGEATLDFTMTESDIEADEVVVTGNSVGTDLQRTPAVVSEVPNSYLQQHASTNIIDALSQVPGVSGITDGQSISKPVVRGLGYNRVVTVNDGVRQEGQQWGDEFGIEVDQNSVDRVEILKGPASLAYGSDAISGVINLIPENTLPVGVVKGEVMTNYQTNNGLGNTMFQLAGNKNNITWSGRVSHLMSHAYQNKNDGYVFNSQYSVFGADGTVGLHRDWGFSQLHYSYYDFTTGIVEGARDSATGKFVKQVLDPEGNPGDAIATNQDLISYTPYLINQIVKHNKLVWDNSISMGHSRIIGRFGWQQNSRREFNDITIADISNIWYFLNSYTYDVRYVSPGVNDFNLSIGVNGMSQNSKNKGTLLLIPEYNSFDVGAFAIATKKINNLDISAGIRYDTRQFKGKDNYIDSTGNELPPTDPNAIHRFTAYDSNFNGVSGSLGLAYQLSNDFYLKANVARGFRAPNVAESGSNGIHDGTVVYEIGDPNLNAENSLQLDFAVGLNSKNITSEIALFTNSITNYIYPKQLYGVDGSDSLDYSTPGFEGAPVFKYTQGDAILTGGEASLDLHPSSMKWFDLNVGFSLVNASLKNTPDSAKYLPFIPPARLHSELTFNINSPCRTFANLYLRLGMANTFSQKNVYHATQIYYDLPDEEAQASTSPSEAYTLFSAGIGTDIMSHANKIFTFYFSVDNLTDVAYKDYMSRFKYYPVNFSANPYRVGVYNMGRNFSFKILVPLDFTRKNV